MITKKNLEEISFKVIDERDAILLEQCIYFMRKVEEFNEIGSEYLTEQDRSEITTMILNIIRIYLISLREHYQEDEDAIKDIINDIQGHLSSIFRVVGGGTKLQHLEFIPSIARVEGVDRQKEFYATLSPFISFVETNIYNCFVASYNKLISQWHSNFCELTAKASGIIREKKEEKLPEIPSIGEEKPKAKAKKTKKREDIEEEYDR